MILDIPKQVEFDEVKKKYRQLMHLVHPDALTDIADIKGIFPYSAHEINTAYAVLKDAALKGTYSPDFGDGVFEDGDIERKRQRRSTGKKEVWTAPKNEYAYIEREVFQYAEDAEGEVIGKFCIARGKYLWTVEEEFPLFLSSVYQDRLYYVVIPMFEQKAVRIRVQAADDKKLKVWLKLTELTQVHMPENLNMQIEELLRKYVEDAEWDI